MNLSFAAVVIVVLFLGAPSLESIGARAQTRASPAECRRACFAAASRTESVIRTYLSQGISLCHCVCAGYNYGGILHVSVIEGCDVCFDLLTVNPGGCPCDDTDYDGNTPLHIAARNCSGPMTSRAIDAGCNADGRNNVNDTPLCLAARNTTGDECGQVVRTLLSTNVEGGSAEPCLICSGNTTACQSCAYNNTCNVLEDDGACNC